MRIIVQPDRSFPSDPGPRAAILVPDSWDDYGYRTSYDLWIRPNDGEMPIEVGRVKIARFNQRPDDDRLPHGTFERQLPGGPETWVSLGQEAQYYEKLMVLGGYEAHEILRSLGDLAARLPTFELLRREQSVATSLLRSVSPGTVTRQFNRIIQGGDRLTTYRFRFHPPREPEASRRPPLEFEVMPESVPPSNIHVLIGRNGVGKTTLLRSLATAAVRLYDRPEYAGLISYDTEVGFANVLLVTFSAFDPFAGILPSHATASYTHVGLTRGPDDHETDISPTPRMKGREELADEFCDSLGSLATAGRFDRWIEAVDTLASDPQFAAAVIGATDGPVPEPPDRRAIEILLGPEHGRDGAVLGELRTGTGRPWRDIFVSLSSGHAIVLLTLTRLVDLVAEQTLVLLDEPEAHLHPPLLASFVRALSDLLAERNGVAITATHSPVVLQEVPRSCVYKIGRTGRTGSARRPRIETYGENVGVLTHEIFGLEVMKSGFYAEIKRAVHEFGTYDQVLDHFGGQLGDEAKGIVRILIADREDEGL
ncbi:AAA family ATPase [Streptomyces sp. Isolate_45]|uniref:AAA family ATPase n=1 Tax=Streptomyces sp. Isolate_45 TaxID=2950111 RepID=UPI002481DD64|nr:AAA family ATPase [Streptomyces sp. Isolate_45]MDA5279940.1 AAA family ATPase [Streptomyces sp. Isolate_45]